MQYRSMGKTGVQVSALGFGCMRLPVLPGKTQADIDEAQAIGMIRSAIDAGLNYVDTAYMYHDQESERLVGKALQDGYRDKVYLATKSPLGSINTAEDFDRILEEQLRKLNTAHIDFYMFHGIGRDRWRQTVLPLGLKERMLQARDAGKIRYIGFSFHDDAEAFREIVDGWDAWDFCQIQMNYVDVYNQATLEGMAYAASKGLGVVIMEPLLGGKLAAPSQPVAQALRGDRTPVEWALDFMWNRPEVSVVLSGMGSPQMVEDNLIYASRSGVGMLDDADLQMLAHARQTYLTMAKAPCTKCRYCMPCPGGLDIPAILEAYNQSAVDEAAAAKLYQALETPASACLACHKCERACPQHIAVSDLLPQVHDYFTR